MLATSIFSAPAGGGSGDDSAPSVDISNPQIKARLYLPDLKRGFYRGTRFDWSGVVGSLQFAGHEFYPPWFQAVDDTVHDFAYVGPRIIASPCTAITGPAEEFSTDGQALGFKDAAPGGTFLKIGVGVLRRPDDRPYDPYRLYPIVSGGEWTIRPHPSSVEFKQNVADQFSGYGYEYFKTVALTKDKPELVLEHRLRNIGRLPIRTSVYNHNFLYLDQQPPGPGDVIRVPFQIQVTVPIDHNLFDVRGNEILFLKELTGEERVFLPSIAGFKSDPADYDIRVENRKRGVGVRITADRPLSKMALWSIRAPLSIEPFISLEIAPGQEFTWQIRYEFYTVPLEH